MKKIVLTALVVLALIFTTASISIAKKEPLPIRLELDGKRLPIEVISSGKSGLTLVPLKQMAQALGAQIRWDGKKQTAVVSKKDTVIQFTVSKAEALKNGVKVKLEAAPVINRNKMMVPLRWLNEALGANVSWDGKTRTISIDHAFKALPAVGSAERLKQLLRESEKARASWYNMGIPEMAFGMEDSARDSASKSGDSAAPSSAPGGSGQDYSATNTQVLGVDEADTVKTDGTYIYQINNDKVIIAEAYPSEQMKVVNSIHYGERKMQPMELYVDANHLVVIGNVSNYLPMDRGENGENSKIAPDIVPMAQKVKAVVYDIGDKANVKQIREIELDGFYVSSRKIGSALYVVTNKNMDYYHIMNEQTRMEAPIYRDSAGSNKSTAIDFKDIRYFPGTVEPNYLLIAGIDLAKPDQKMNVSSFVGSGNNVYASQEHLYVAVAKYEVDNDHVKTSKESRKDAAIMKPPTSKTTVYQFALDQGRAKYRGHGEVPGVILNQFSMDEHNGNFRIATTTGEMWRTDEFTSKNHMYILNEQMKVTGKLENVAPGERIYSVRFMGNRAYMVTFKSVDPLFVIDLANPQAPKILGALKIPGYSDYLHPYDENHIIGFGKDTVELSQKDENGSVIGTTAYYQGMKLALFDVTDVANPKERFKENIGDRGTDSELLRNHKALLFSKDKNLLAFPVTLMKINKPDPNDSVSPQYGEFSFQGAYVYSLDLTHGFRLKGTITHLSDEDMNKSGYGWYESNKNVERILYIKDRLYTVSKGLIKANDIDSLHEINKLTLPQ